MKTFETAQEFYDFCVDNLDDEPFLVEIKGLTIAEWWDKTQHGKYMLWLRNEQVWKFTPVQQEEYHRVAAAGAAKFHHVALAAWKEYHRVAVAELEEYHRVTAWEEYHRVAVASWEEYNRVKVAAAEDFHRVTANAIRSIVGNPWRVKQ